MLTQVRFDEVPKGREVIRLPAGNADHVNALVVQGEAAGETETPARPGYEGYAFGHGCSLKRLKKGGL